MKFLSPMSKLTYETLLLDEPADGVLVVRINRPHAANAINTQLGRDLLALFGHIADGDAFRCIVLTGAGDRHFCAGGDLKERNGFTDAQFLAQHQIFERMILAIMECQVPLVAAVNGPAFAGGCEIMLACDFAYAANNARFALTETSLGIMPGCGGTQNLPRAVGLRRAKELIFAAKPFSADDAFAWGLVNKLCEPGTVVDAALHTARDISANAPLSLRQAKRSMNFGQGMDLRTAMFFEVDAYNRLVATQDRREGINAFVEKRKPLFTGV
jgi:enoyl-CoA hydratase